MKRAMIICDVPKGKANDVRAALERALFVFKSPDEVWVSKAQDRIRFTIKGDFEKLMALNRQVQNFRMLADKMHGNFLMKKAVKKLADNDKVYNEVMLLLKENTKIRFKFL